jgi:hypothetical protein
LGEMYENINRQVAGLLTSHWRAIAAVARAIVERDWVPVTPDDRELMAPEERSLFKRGKHLDGA